MAVEYAKDRRPVRTAHRLVPGHQAQVRRHAGGQVESAKAAAYYAALGSVRRATTRSPMVAPLAKSYCSEAYFQCASENIQIHGGIGFTWEHDAHLYFKRAKSSELMFGSPSAHRKVLADRLGI
jgi:alkylation response protein AidB-like acyl-CoA dehydrogenase